MSHNIKLSRSLSRILRHSAVEDGFHIDSAGYIAVEELLASKFFRQISFLDIQDVVNNNEKQRFGLKQDGGKWFIRANQGHSINSLQADKILKEITDPANLPICVHGTNFTAWKAIKDSGHLSRMKRNHIHFCSGFPDYMRLTSDQEANLMKHFDFIDKFVVAKSGMRRSATVLIFVDVKKAMKDGIKFLKSENEVILSEGNKEGKLSKDYFLKVYDFKTESLLEF